jgi:glycosyltransferase involved in cell wall biosynthesis
MSSASMSSASMSSTPVPSATMSSARMPSTTVASASIPFGRDAALLTVVIPVYNGARFLPGCVASILRQDYSALEIIVVDDGSTDAIEAAIQALPVDVRFFRQSRAGPAAARNRGIRDASGDLLAFLDVDDVWPEDTLTPLVARLLSCPAALVARGAAQLVREDAEGALHYLGNAAETFPFHIGAGVYRRAAFRAIGLFDENLMFGEDTDWYNRLREHNEALELIDQITLLVRRHDGNMTRGKSHVEVNALRVFKKMLDRRRAAAGHADG